MQPTAPSEATMWLTQLSLPRAQPSDIEINEKYESGEQRIVTESNREKLPNFVEALKKPNYILLKPFYQRRRRWDVIRQSRLIESFIINVPVPPIFLYERAYSSYEVMDAQQRITAIQDFYENRLTLNGLERWPELNGRSYQQLPSKIRAGIDRRSISSIVLLKESAQDDEEATLLKQLVFERLNTGGVKLSHQEIRNALYQGKFNYLLLDLTRNPEFRDCWGIPRATETEEIAPSFKLLSNLMWQKMEDVELVLRFFALRHVEHFQGGMQPFLTKYSIRSLGFGDDDLAVLRTLFQSTFGLAHEVFGDLTFRPYNLRKDRWDKSPQKAFYDAVMVSLSRRLDRWQDFVENRDQIISRSKQLFVESPPGTFTGRGNSKADIENRITRFGEMLDAVIAG
jgi:hypothetical protein